MNNYANNQARANTSNIQNDVEQVTGQPIRVYPFKIVSGLNYLSNRGLSNIGTNPGQSYPNMEQGTITNIDYGAYSDLSLIYSGNRPIIAYWFGVMNATMNGDGTITETINATLDSDGNWVPNMFSNPLTAQAVDSSKSDATQWQDMEQQNPWKNVGVIDYSYAPNHTYTHQLDNVECGIYEMVYNYSCISNEWNPSYQEINEFIYFIIDIRYPCPIALRISGVSPHYRPDGVFQWADIQFQSINQYFNTSSYSILTYVKFGAPNDAYCFPKEIIVDGELKTIINPNFLLPRQGGVDSVCIKNNSLVAHLGTLIYGHAYVPFQEQNGVLTRTNEADRYLIPLSFEAPINDNIVSKHSLVHSSYSLAMNMVVISEQLWGSWKQTKETYNPIQNFTFQGGLAFAGGTDFSSNTVLYDTISKILNPNGDGTLNNQIMKILSPCQTGYFAWGSYNLQSVIYSNRSNLPLDILQIQQWQAIGSSNNPDGVGFYLDNDCMTFDFRGSGLVASLANSEWETLIPLVELPNIINTAADIFNLGYTPNTQGNSEIGYLTALSNGSLAKGSFILPNVAFTLNSMSMINVHMLEVNYRDGIVYTNTNRGHGGFLNAIANWFSGIADKITGYTPGTAQFFMNTAARTYNLFIPSSLLPLFQQYLDPNAKTNYNAVPLDIFNNSYDNNTAVGQLQYMSGLQFSLTDTYANTQNTNLYTTKDWGKLTKDMFSSSALTYNITNFSVIGEQTQFTFPAQSFAFFLEPVQNANNASFVIDEINVKELGQSNIHLSYFKKVNGKLVSVGEEWAASNAKVLKNNAYIDNDFDYYVYDEYNTAFESNVSPYIDLQYTPYPAQVNNVVAPTYELPSGASRGTYSLNANAPMLGIVVQGFDKSNWADYSNDGNTNYNFPSFTVSNGTCYGIQTVACGSNDGWYTTSLTQGNSFGSSSSTYIANNQVITIDNTGYINRCSAAPTNTNDRYLTATEYAYNIILNNMSMIGNGSGYPYGWGQCLACSDYVYYDIREIVFSFNTLLSSVQNQWAYTKNTKYTNIMCLVPADYTDDQINAIAISSDLPSENFIGFYDGKTLYPLGIGGSIKQPASLWNNAYGYMINSQPSLGDYAFPNDVNNVSASSCAFFETITWFNSGGIVSVEALDQPIFSKTNGGVLVNSINMGDYSSNATVGGTTGGTYQQIALAEYFYPNAIPYLPTTATSQYKGNKYKLVMIVLK